MAEAYPLYWPDGWKRCASYARSHLQGRLTFGQARDRLLRELRLLGAANVVLSTNIPLRRDGLPYADYRRPDDPGVSVFFTYSKRHMCFACDRYHVIEDNVRAIALTIEALRGIERWGASDMIERAFRGFTAITQAASRSWREVFGFGKEEEVSAGDVEAMFRKLAHERHPDHGGSDAAMTELNLAREQAKAEAHA
jgi:hypothetical protein